MEEYIYTDITELVCPIGTFSVNYENTKIPFSVRKNSYNVPYYDITIDTNYALDINTDLLEKNKQYDIIFSEGGLHFCGSDEYTESITATIGNWSVGIGSYDINEKCYYTNEPHKGYDVWKNENGYGFSFILLDRSVKKITFLVAWIDNSAEKDIDYEYALDFWLT